MEINIHTIDRRFSTIQAWFYTTLCGIIDRKEVKKLDLRMVYQLCLFARLWLIMAKVRTPRLIHMKSMLINQLGYSTLKEPI